MIVPATFFAVWSGQSKPVKIRRVAVQRKTKTFFARDWPLFYFKIDYKVDKGLTKKVTTWELGKESQEQALHRRTMFGAVLERGYKERKNRPSQEGQQSTRERNRRQGSRSGVGGKENTRWEEPHLEGSKEASRSSKECQGEAHHRLLGRAFRMDRRGERSLDLEGGRQLEGGR